MHNLKKLPCPNVIQTLNMKLKCGKRFYAEFLESIDRINKRESDLEREGKNTPPPCPNVNVDESVCRGKTISRESPSQPGVFNIEIVRLARGAEQRHEFVRGFSSSWVLALRVPGNPSGPKSGPEIREFFQVHFSILKIDLFNKT